MDHRKTVFTQGQFMFPQHLQQQTRYLEYLVSSASAGFAANWGFLNLQLDLSLLGSGILNLRHAAGRFQDGTAFELAVNATCTATDAIRPGAEDELVYLCIPQRDSALDGQEFQRSASDRSLVRYAVEMIEVADSASELILEDYDNEDDLDADEFEQTEFSGVRSVRMMVGQLQLTLLLESADRHAYHCLPVARIDTIKANGEVTLHQGFIAPVLDSRASPVLSEAIAELKTVVDSRARELAEAVGDFVVTGEINANVLWLSIANKYHLILSELSSSGGHPLSIYKLLLGMAGELATLTRPEKRLLEAPDYQHSNLQVCYEPLLELLRTMWGRPRHEAAIQLPLVFDDDILAWISSIRVRDYLQDRSFYFAVTADTPANEIAQSLVGNLTVGPIENIFERIQRGEGLEVTRLDARPRHLPELKNWVYFEILKGPDTVWREIERSEAFAIHVDTARDNFPGLRFRFWAVND